jgi:hypothetical protein
LSAKQEYDSQEDQESYTDDWYDESKEKKKQQSESESEGSSDKDQEDEEMNDLVNAHNYEDKIQA